MKHVIEVCEVMAVSALCLAILLVVASAISGQMHSGLSLIGGQ